jgi:hypothetical protein
MQSQTFPTENRKLKTENRKPRQNPSLFLRALRPRRCTGLFDANSASALLNGAGCRTDAGPCSKAIDGTAGFSAEFAGYYCIESTSDGDGSRRWLPLE